METLSMVTCFTCKQTPPPTRFLSRTATALSHLQKSKLPIPLSRTRIRAVSEIAEEDVLQAFFEERKLNADFISKTSDMLWQREVMKFEDVTDDRFTDTSQEVLVDENDDGGGFLKLSATQAWVSGGNSAPINKKVGDKILPDDRERRKKLNFLKYEALKRELMLLSVGIGTACSGYCLIVFSFQAAISYAVGALSSCLYLQLLYRHADKLSKDMVPDIFTQKKTKKIGIRSEDIQNVFEKSVRGSSIALSSPRLLIPAAIYAIWILSHKYLANDFFDFQLTPAMVGMFVYKAAALVQVYRDNENLRLDFPENDGGSA
ncbi:uncharacterized protein LOC111471665 [Cucurbita maxima]|uniref:Uncharacterized protein LOC111471665 n=1 Tax=Cucurbita maxima TaxID=3661 RepID=A0A6J1IAM8_CUCMA|nr:uncharacterized protein LOC111471665 [Cucurbita maxima]